MYQFGGFSRTLLDDFTVWDGGRWSLVERSDPWPPPRRDPMFALLGDDRLMLAGGRSSDGVLGDTWVWTRAKGSWTKGSWKQVTTPGPSARYGAGIATVGESVIYFGGATADSDLSDTWQFDVSGWTELHPATSPSLRYYPVVAATADGGLRLFGGGITSAGGVTTILSDLWDFRFVNGAPTWTQLGADEDTRRRRGGMATDRLTGRTVLYGGSGDDARSELFDFTVSPGVPYTGAVREDAQTRPRRRYLQTFAANPAGGGLVTYGGFSSDADSLLSDTWQLQLFGAACTQSDQCGHGQSCTEGVCCESSACAPCDSCAVPGHVGSCTPRGSYGPEPGCDAPGRACSADGHCRLADQGRCSDDEACASGTCLNGVADAGGVCCTAAGCAVQCVPGSNDLQTPGGAHISCGAYGCNVDHCNQTCRDVDDCAAGAVCTDQHQCLVPPTAGAPPEGGCSCRTGSGDRGTAGFAFLVSLGLLGWRRRLRVGRVSA